jgi:uncharacterized repeat protein (TIGR04076 family)
MYELWVSVERIEGACSGPVPMVPGTGFLVRNGSLHFPGGGPICLYALQSLMPLLPAKERRVDEAKADDWLWRVDTVQCPDPKGHTVWKIEQRPLGSTRVEPPALPSPEPGDLRISVERVDGACTSGMAPGRYALLRGSSLYLPQPFCLYALQAVAPLLPAMQRPLAPDDWMASENAVVCPDPAGDVILRIEKIEGGKR